MQEARGSDTGHRTAVVTGANRGLGLELTRRYLEQGWRVVAGCRRPSAASELDLLAAAHGDRLSVLGCDLLQPESIGTFARALLALVPRVELLINNAGYLDRSDESLERTTEDSLMLAYRTNALGPLLMTRELMAGLSAAAPARVVNISSSMGSMGFDQSPGSYGYRMSKAALNMFTVNLASELAGRGVTVVALDPGWVRTDMGGEHARLSVGASVDGLMRVIDSLGPADSGRLARYDGTALPF